MPATAQWITSSIIPNLDLQRPRNYPVLSQRVVLMPISTNRCTITDKDGLCIIPRGGGATDRVTPIRARGNCADGGGKFTWRKRTPDRGCNVEITKRRTNQHSAQDLRWRANDIPISRAENVVVSSGGPGVKRGHVRSYSVPRCRGCHGSSGAERGPRSIHRSFRQGVNSEC